jgi:hypothetical protein
MVEFNFKDEDLDDLMDDAAIEGFCACVDGALDEVMGPKVTDYDFLVTVLNDVVQDPNTKADFAFSLMQKDDLLAVGIYKLDNSESPKPEKLPRELTLDRLASSVFAGVLHTANRERIL